MAWMKVVAGALLAALICIGPARPASAEDGYDLWLRYQPVAAEQLAAYRQRVTELEVVGSAATLVAVRSELIRGLNGLLNYSLPVVDKAIHFLRLIQTRQSLDRLDIASAPRIQLRTLDHWDNLNRTVERGYAGSSLWDWHKLPVCTLYDRSTLPAGPFEIAIDSAHQ